MISGFDSSLHPASMFLAERSSKEELEYPLSTSNMETLHGIAGRKYCSHSAGWHHQQQMSVSSSQDQHAHLSTSPSSVSTISTFMTANPCQPAFDDAVQSHLEVRSQFQSTADFLNCSFCGYNLPSDDVPPRGNSCFSSPKRRPQFHEFDFFGSNLEESFEACTRRSDVDCTLSLGSIVTGRDVCRDSSRTDATMLQSRSDSPLLSCNRLQAILALKRSAPDSHLLAAARAEEELEQGRCTIEGACKRQAFIDYAASCSSKGMIPLAHSLIDGPYSSIYNVSHEWMRRTRFNFDPDMSRPQAAPKMFITASSADSYAHAARLSEEEETTGMSRSSVPDQRSSCRYRRDKVFISRISSAPVVQNMQINPTSTTLHGGSAADFQIVVKRPLQSIVGPKQYPSDQWQLINGSTSKGRLMHEHEYDMKVMSCWQDAGALSLIDQSSTCTKGQQRHAVTRVCAQCKTMKTPLWRNGPQGPKSLCNACGIRYKKEERRTSGKYPTDSASPRSTISNYRSIMFSDKMNSKERDLINKHHDADDINEPPFPCHDIPRHVDAALQLCSYGEGVTDKQLVGAEDENGILACRFGDGALSNHLKLTSICASTSALLASSSPLSIAITSLGPGSSAQDVLHRQTSSSSSTTARDFLNCLGVH